MAVLMRLVPLLCAVLAGCAYEAPINTVSAPEILNAVNGTVVFAGTGDIAPTYVTVFDARNPAPPAGTGSPETFSAIPPSAWSVEDAGLRSAPWAVTRLPAGRWSFNALVDTDGDFNPLSAPLAGATCGDWGGAYLADLAGTPAAVEVSGGRRYDDITLLVGQQFATERPAFQFATPPELSLAAVLGQTVAPLFRLTATAVDTLFSEDLRLTLGPACTPSPDVPDCTQGPVCPCDVGSLAPCGTALWVWFVDADADGVVDPYPAPVQAESGVLDVWPRIYLDYTGEMPPFERDGETFSERWVSEAFPLAAEIGGAALAGGVPPGVAAGALGPIGTPFPAHDLSVTFVPIFRHYHADGSAGTDPNGPFDVVDPSLGDPVSNIPTGAWAVTVVSFTGQTWTLPNDIGTLGLPSLDPTFEPAAQGAALTLEP